MGSFIRCTMVYDIMNDILPDEEVLGESRAGFGPEGEDFVAEGHLVRPGDPADDDGGESVERHESGVNGPFLLDDAAHPDLQNYPAPPPPSSQLELTKSPLTEPRLSQLTKSPLPRLALPSLAISALRSPSVAPPPKSPLLAAAAVETGHPLLASAAVETLPASAAVDTLPVASLVVVSTSVTG
nr:hypothetical protein CDL12_06077 [Ipomoea batatas]